MQYFNDDFSHVHLAPEQFHTTAGSEKIPDDATPCIFEFSGKMLNNNWADGGVLL